MLSTYRVRRLFTPHFGGTQMINAFFQESPPNASFSLPPPPLPAYLPVLLRIPSVERLKDGFDFLACRISSPS